MKALPPFALCTDCPMYGNCALAKLDTPPSAEQPIDIARYGPLRTYRSGEYILHQENVFSLVPMICRGLVTVVVFAEEGEEILLRTLGPGDIIGLSDWLEGADISSLAAKAVTDVAVHFAIRGNPLTLLQGRDATSGAFLKQIGAHIRTAQHVVICLRRRDAYARILLAIHELIRLFQLKRENPLIMPYKIPRWFFASYTELRPETVSRMLTRLRNEGLIAYRKNRIVIPNLHKLESRISRTPASD